MRRRLKYFLALVATLFVFQAKASFAATTLAPGSANFGPVLVGTASAPQVFNATVSGIDRILDVLVTDNVNYTIIADTCSGLASIGPALPCSFSIQFNPNSIGVIPQAEVRLAAVFDFELATLDGTGVANPGALLNPTELDFGLVGVGQSSPALATLLSNNGTSDLTVNVGPVISGADALNFSLQNAPNACIAGLVLEPGQSCVAQVVYTPDAVLPDSASLDIDTDAGIVSAALEGIGINGPGIVVVPSALTFGDVGLGQTSPSQLVQVTSIGTDDLQVSSATLNLNNDFVITSNTCDGTSLAPGGSCIVEVACAPSVLGSPLPQDTLDIASNSPSDPTVSVTLDCNGVGGPIAEANPTALDFGQVAVGQTSASNLVQVTNTGTDTLNVSAATITSGIDFLLTGNTCDGAALAPGGSCTVAVACKPDDDGVLTQDTLEVASDDPASPLSVTLDCEGVEGPAISVNPDPMTFPDDQAVGTISPARLIVVTNVGTDDVTSLSVGPLGGLDFALTQDTCSGTDLAPAASCIVLATFNPTTTGALSDFFTITADDGISEDADLNGTGVQATIDITGTTAFGNVNVGSESTEVLTVTNNGDAPVSLAAVKQTGDNPEQFIVSDDTCSYAVLDPSESCAFDVTFRPLAGGAFVDVITVASTSNQVSTANLSGTGIVPTPPGVGLLQIKTDVLDFDLEIGQNSTQSTTITNIGDANVSINSLVLDGDTNFTQTNDCDGQTLAAGDSCSVTVTFTAGSTNGNFSGVVSIDSNPASTDFLVLLGSALTDDDTIDGGGCSLASASSGLPIGAAWLWMAPVAAMALIRRRSKN